MRITSVLVCKTKSVVLTLLIFERLVRKVVFTCYMQSRGRGISPSQVQEILLTCYLDKVQKKKILSLHSEFSGKMLSGCEDARKVLQYPCCCSLKQCRNEKILPLHQKNTKHIIKIKIKGFFLKK